MELHEIGINNVHLLKKEKKIPELEGYLIEALREYPTRTKVKYSWEKLNSKIYNSLDAAKEAYLQKPKCYKGHDIKVRFVPLHRSHDYSFFAIQK